MEKNTLLRIALVCGKRFAGIMMLVLLVVVGLFTHWHLQPDAYQDVTMVVRKNEVHFSKTEEPAPASQERSMVQVIMKPGLTFDSEMGRNLEKELRVPVQQISIITIYLLFLQFVAWTVVLLLILREILNVIKSVQGLSTFQSRNVQSFRRIGFLCLALALLQGFYVLKAADISVAGFSLQMMPLVFMLAAFIMAEIFKEGNRLYEQEQLTI